MSTWIDDFQCQVEKAGPLSCPKQELPYLLGTILAFQLSSQPISNGIQIANVWENTYTTRVEKTLKESTRRWLFPLARTIDITRRIWTARCMLHNAPSDILKEAVMGGACFECFDQNDKHAYTVYEQLFEPLFSSRSTIELNLDLVPDTVRPSEYETLKHMVASVNAAVSEANTANNDDSPYSAFLLSMLGSLAFDGDGSVVERNNYKATIKRVVKSTVGGCDVQ